MGPVQLYLARYAQIPQVDNSWRSRAEFTTGHICAKRTTLITIQRMTRMLPRHPSTQSPIQVSNPTIGSASEAERDE